MKYEGYLPLIKPTERTLECIYKENRISQETLRLTLSLNRIVRKKSSVICALLSFLKCC